jgi:hypothetical protein
MVPDHVAVALKKKFSMPIELATGKSKM